MRFFDVDKVKQSTAWNSTHGGKKACPVTSILTLLHWRNSKRSVKIVYASDGLVSQILQLLSLQTEIIQNQPVGQMGRNPPLKPLIILSGLDESSHPESFFLESLSAIE